MKVLYVDHDMNRVSEFTELFAQHFNLEVAFTGWEGLGAAMLYPPNIMVLNLNVAVMDGIELLRLLRTEEKLLYLPVLGFTDPQNHALEQKALEMTCSRIFTYPFNKASLNELIGTTFSQSQPNENSSIVSQAKSF